MTTEVLIENMEYRPENWEAFEALFIEKYPIFSDEWRIIGDAYRLAKAAHMNQTRDDGVRRYFEHPRAVAAMPWIRQDTIMCDPAFTAGLLLHDVPEDSGVLFPKVQYKRAEGDIMYSYSVWKREATRYLTNNVGEEAAKIALALTKPHVEGIEIKDKTQATEIYLVQLEEGGPKVIVAKMYDNLHNMQTLGSLPEEKQRRQVEKSRNIYRPIFELALDSPEYGDLARSMLADIDEAIENIVSKWKQ